MERLIFLHFEKNNNHFTNKKCYLQTCFKYNFNLLVRTFLRDIYNVSKFNYKAHEMKPQEPCVNIFIQFFIIKFGLQFEL